MAASDTAHSRTQLGNTLESHHQPQGRNQLESRHQPQGRNQLESRHQNPLGIVLVWFGAPESSQHRAVNRFMKAILKNDSYVRNQSVSFKLFKRRKMYRQNKKFYQRAFETLEVDGRIPFRMYAQKMSSALESQCAARGFSICVESAELMTRDSVEQAFNRCNSRGALRVLVLPLFPQISMATSNCLREKVRAAIASKAFSGQAKLVPQYFNNNTYHRAIAARIRSVGFEPESDDLVIFAYQSVPIEDIEAGDDYEIAVGSTSLSIAGELDIARNRWTIGYYDPFYVKQPSLAPHLKDVLNRYAESGYRRIFLVCPGAAIDDVDTSIGIGRIARQVYADSRRRHGLTFKSDDFVFVPGLNATKAQVSVLSAVVFDTLKGNHAN